MKTQRVGCNFARAFAKRPNDAGLQGVTVLGNTFGQNEITPLNAFLDAAHLKAEAVLLVFPDVITLEHIVGLIRALCASPVWQCVELTTNEPMTNEALLLGVRWRLPDNKHINYVLGFADFVEMPRTRHAPYTAMMLRTGPTGRAPGIAYRFGVNPKDDLRASEPPPIPVHLADMADMLPAEADVARVWQQTTQLKRKELAGDNMADAARAKITFSLPGNARDQLNDVIVERMPLTAAAMS